MITLYSGTPGSGKSYHVAIKIYYRLGVAKKDIIATFPIDMDIVSKNGRRDTGYFTYCDIMSLTPEYLIDYAKRYHVLGKESQTLVIVDECQIIFNPREFTRNDRLKWITFFTQHRKLGYDFILISQFDRLLDRQIRCLLEYEVKHRKVNNFGMGRFFPFPLFVGITSWYCIRQKIDHEFFIYRNKYGSMYDTYKFFDGSISGLDKKKQATDTDAAGDARGPSAAGAAGAVS